MDLNGDYIFHLVQNFSTYKEPISVLWDMNKCSFPIISFNEAFIDILADKLALAHMSVALVVYGGYAPVGRIHVPFTHRDCCVKKEV